jgi:hypothetical protein
MAKYSVQLPDSFIKGLVCKVNVSLNGKHSSKELKVCSVKARSVIFIEVDKANRQNIFRKVDKADIVEFRPTAICEITVKDGILPVRWESSWDSIGQVSQSVGNQFGKRSFSNHSKGWAPVIKAPMGASMDALAVSVSNRSTTNSAAGFPMV